MKKKSLLLASMVVMSAAVVSAANTFYVSAGGSTNYYKHCADIVFGTNEYTGTVLHDDVPYASTGWDAVGSQVAVGHGELAYYEDGGDYALRIEDGGSYRIDFTYEVIIKEAKVYAYGEGASVTTTTAFGSATTVLDSTPAGDIDISAIDETPDEKGTYCLTGLDGDIYSATSCFSLSVSGGTANIMKVVFDVYSTDEEPAFCFDDIEIHMLESGTDYTGDCTYVRAGEYDILIDGSPRDSDTLMNNMYPKFDSLCADKVFEFAVVTHAHQDHLGLFGKASNSIFANYKIETLIDFPKTDSTSQIYGRYKTNRALASAQYTALECYNADKVVTPGEDGSEAARYYTLGKGLYMEILYNGYYERSASGENDYSVCLRFVQGNNEYLFMGDCEDAAEKTVVANNDLNHVVFYHANHHGSRTSSGETLMAAITPTYIGVSCVAGNSEYSTATYANKMPAQETIDRWAPYTEKIMCLSQMDPDTGELASMNGEIIVMGTGPYESDVTMVGSTDSTYLRYTKWFSATGNYEDLSQPNRVWPEATGEA